MEILHHHIDKTQIVGIGPLMFQQHTDQQIRMLYKLRQLFFYVHLKHQSIKIESDWFDLDEEVQLKKYKEYQAQYEKDKAAVLELIDANELSNFL